jgi:hypothetical protein
VQDNESASMSEGQGADAANSGMLQAGGTLLSGLGKAGSSAYAQFGGSGGSSPTYTGMGSSSYNAPAFNVN